MISRIFPTARTTVTEYEWTEEVMKNPLMGFAPRADIRNKVGDNSLVYIDITFKELEPSEGDFDFESFEEKNSIDRYRKEGRHAVLRLVNDYPHKENHLDIPEWLYIKTGKDGVFYDNAYGRGYAPNYTNAVFIEHHKLALEALGRRYGKDTFISYVQLGSLGHWGEWHVHQNSDLPLIPDEAIRRHYVDPYKEAFPNAKILMRRPFKCAEEHGFGLYNDMIGHAQSSRQWLAWIHKGGSYDQTHEKNALVPMPDAWKTAPVGGELTSAAAMTHLLTTQLTETCQQIRDAHTTFIGPMIPDEHDLKEKRYRKGIEDILRSTGYQLGITKVTWTESRKHSVKVKMVWVNAGVAPMYWDWPVHLYFIGNDDVVLDKVNVDVKLTELLPGKTMNTTTRFTNNKERNRAEAVYIGIMDPMTNKPAVRLLSSQERLGNLSLVKR